MSTEFITSGSVFLEAYIENLAWAEPVGCSAKVEILERIIIGDRLPFWNS